MLLLDSNQAAKYLGGEKTPISKTTLEGWRYSGQGPMYIKIGRLVRYRRDDLDAWLSARTRANTSQQ